jgi:hypothetical protein
MTAVRSKRVLTVCSMAAVAACLVWGTTAAAAGQLRSGAARPARDLPSATSVVRGRYVSTVRLDRGTLGVSPPGAISPPRFSRAVAMREFSSDARLEGYHAITFGYGIATITKHTNGIARITRLPAWVGFAQSTGAYNCPAFGSGSPRPPTPPWSGYAALVIGAKNGSPAVNYVARSEACNSVAPASLSSASETVSVPWSAIGPVDNGTVAVQATVPPCGGVAGISAGGSASSMTISIGAVVPDVLHHCHGPKLVKETVVMDPAGGPGAPPQLVSGTTAILHGRLGPVTMVQPG